MAYYQDTPAPYVGPTRDAWADQYKNLQLLLPIMAQEEEQQRANAAAKSKFAQGLVDALREPVKQEMQPTYGSLGPQVSGDYQTIAPNVGLQGAPPPMGGAMPGAGAPPARPDALPPAPTVNPQLGAAMQGAMRNPEVPDAWRTGQGPLTMEIGNAPHGLMRGQFHGSGHPFLPGPGAPGTMPMAYPQNAAEMAIFQHLAPYITQRRSTEEAYRRGIGEAVVKGNYGRDRTAVNDATKLAQSMLAFKKPRALSGSQDAYWRKYVPLLQNDARSYMGAQNELNQMDMNGWARARPGSPQQQMYMDKFAEVDQLGKMLQMRHDEYSRVIGAQPQPEGQSKSKGAQSEELDLQPMK